MAYRPAIPLRLASFSPRLEGGIDSLCAADSSRKAVTRAAKEVATAAENVAKAKKNLDTLAKRARVAECSATASAAESRALFSGDATSPRLTKKGRLLAAELKAQSAWEHETKVKRLMRHVTSEAKAREKAKDLAKIASDKAEKLTLQRDKPELKSDVILNHRNILILLDYSIHILHNIKMFSCGLVFF